MRKGPAEAIAIEVTGAASVADAVTAGRAVAGAPTCSSAPSLAGSELGPGTGGRGYHRRGVRARPAERGDQQVWVCRIRRAADDRSLADLRPRDVTITVDLAAGPHAATILTTDLTAEYVYENSAYST